MIRSLLVGAARVLFNLAVVFFALGALLLYGAYRLVRSSVAKSENRPVREAGFGALLAAVALVQALRAAAPSPPSIMEEVGRDDVEAA